MTGRPRTRAPGALVLLGAVLVGIAWGAAAPDPASAQEAVDTARPGTEPPGSAPPRQVIAPDSARLDTLVAEVASKLRCPVCRNQSVLESTATLSRQMQSVIREKLAAGESPEEIKAYFVDKYGEWILLRPEAEGIGLLVYVLPALALVAGGVLVFVLLRRWSREPDPAGPAAGEERDRAEGPAAGDPGEGLEHIPSEDREWLRREIEAG